MLTHQQLENRSKGLGGSDAAAVIGWSKYKSPFDVWRDKTGKSENIDNEAMRIGRELEPFARELYIKETGHDVTVPEETLFHKKHKCILANPDGVVPSKGIGLEIKTTRNDSLLNLKDITENKDWLCQIAHYAEVLGLAKFDVFVMHVETHKTKLYHYNASEQFQNALIAKEVKFWNDHIVANVPPVLRDIKDIKNHFKVAEDIEAVADSDTVAKVNRIIQLHKIAKEMEEEVQLLKTDIFLEMGTANTLVDESGRKLATWNERASNRFDSTALKKVHPELFEQFYITGKTRTFLPNYKLGE